MLLMDPQSTSLAQISCDARRRLSAKSGLQKCGKEEEAYARSTCAAHGAALFVEELKATVSVRDAVCPGNASCGTWSRVAS
jgi:hypothetical protein